MYGLRLSPKAEESPRSLAHYELALLADQIG